MHPDISYPVLVPNLEGMQNALKAGAKTVAVFTAVSETFSQKNTHCSIEESFIRIQEVLKLAKENKIPVRAYISCVLGCPYEGEIAPEVTLKIARRLFELGCYEISLGDTIGTGTAFKAQNLIKTLVPYIPLENLAIHFHDTYGQALANIFACLELGVSTIDSAVGGLGGCPYAKGATGNVATEDLLYMLQGLNIETGVDLSAILEICKFVREFTQHPPRSKVAVAKLG
jgi:hydroxymethylglutaryl-CoA lyase